MNSPFSPSNFKLSTSVSHGFGLVEMLVGAAVLSVTLFAVSNFFRTTVAASKSTQAAIQGDYLLEEGVEVVKLLRDTGYNENISKMSTTTPVYILWNGSTWATTTVNTLIDNKFERKITAADVVRDADNDIAQSGVFDPDSKFITVSVSWMSSVGTTTRTIQTYVMNIFNN